MKDKLSQKNKILEHIKKYGSITKMEALKKYGVMNTGDVIYTLRKEGHAIDTEFVRSKNGSKYARYIYTEPVQE